MPECERCHKKRKILKLACVQMNICRGCLERIKRTMNHKGRRQMSWKRCVNCDKATRTNTAFCPSCGGNIFMKSERRNRHG